MQRESTPDMIPAVVHPSQPRRTVSVPITSGVTALLAPCYVLSFALPIETYTAKVESIKNLTQDARRFDLRLIEPKTIH